MLRKAKKRTVKHPSLGPLDSRVVCKRIPRSVYRDIMKRDAKIFAALAKCDTND